MCILGTSQIQDLDPSRVVCVLCSFSTLSLTHAPALYSYGLLASPGTDMPYPGSLDESYKNLYEHNPAAQGKIAMPACWIACCL